MITTYHNVPEPTSEAVKTILQDVLQDGDSVVTFDVVVSAVGAFDCDGPYATAKRLGLLVNNSAEDMAVDFMSYANMVLYKQHY